MSRCVKLFLLAIPAIFRMANGAWAGDHDAWLSPEGAGMDFAVQGESSGDIQTEKGQLKLGIQVIANGDQTFRATAYHGGLPGDGWNREDVIYIYAAGIRGQAVTTLGAKPPEGAVVIFDGTSTDQLEDGATMTESNLLEHGFMSRPRFGDYVLHLEFMLSYMPSARGQERSNSGLYVQGRFEIQILDSFGLSGEDYECGGMYSVAKPAVNMCFPPLSWQTYDVDFTAARFNDAGEKIAKSRVTVRHNGVIIHDDVEVSEATPSNALPDGPEPGPVFIQDHGNPLRFRNIWGLETKPKDN